MQPGGARLLRPYPNKIRVHRYPPATDPVNARARPVQQQARIRQVYRPNVTVPAGIIKTHHEIHPGTEPAKALREPPINSAKHSRSFSSVCLPTVS